MKSPADKRQIEQNCEGQIFMLACCSSLARTFTANTAPHLFKGFLRGSCRSSTPQYDTPLIHYRFMRKIQWGSFLHEEDSMGYLPEVETVQAKVDGWYSS